MTELNNNEIAEISGGCFPVPTPDPLRELAKKVKELIDDVVDLIF
jgi:hypothetical protein